MAGNAIANSWKAEILDGVHTTSDSYKIALFTSSATYNKNSTVYTTTNEITGTGYTAGGVDLSTPSVQAIGDRRCLKFAADPTWYDASFTARYAVIYNSSKSNKVVCVLDFGTDVSAFSGTFVVDLGNQLTSGAAISFSGTTITRASGDFAAEGYKVGHTIITNSANNPGPFNITAVSALTLTVGSTLVSEGQQTITLGAIIIAL